MRSTVIILLSVITLCVFLSTTIAENLDELENELMKTGKLKVIFFQSY